jgi:tRNA pseudouridine13 synthase
LNVPRHAIGYAGLKDARAVALQWFSVQDYRGSLESLPSIEGITFRRVTRHKNKLKLGHLRGNRFRVRIREVAVGARAGAEAILAVMTQRGMPNWFGEQRFGSRGDTHRLGRALLTGELGEYSAILAGADRVKRRLFLSATQAELFNSILRRRLEHYDTVEAGDIAWLHRNGACFEVREVEVDRARAANFEISATGPLFGAKCMRPSGEPLAIEESELTAAGLTHEQFAGRRELDGARRPLRVPVVAAITASAESERTLDLAIELPPGAYATTLLRELTKDAATGAEPDRLKDGESSAE